MRNLVGALAGLLLIAGCAEPAATTDDVSDKESAKSSIATTEKANPSGESSTTTAPVTTTPSVTTEPPEPETVTLSSSGQLNTDPFSLEGGAYAITFDFGGECFYGARLAPTGAGFGDSVATGSGPTSGATNIYGVEGGQYYLEMITGPPPGCPWTVTLTARDDIAD